MHSLSILMTVFTEAFPAPPVLLYAYSCLNLAMLGEAVHKDVLRECLVWGVFKNFC